MAIQPWTFQGHVTKTYNGKPLGLMDEINVLEADRYYIDLTKEKFDAIPNVQDVFCIMANQMKSPLEQAEVLGQDSAIIMKISDEYTQAMEKYKNDLISASQVDATVINMIDRIPHFDDFWGFIRDLWTLITGYYETKRRGSATRYAWMVQVGAQEAQRKDRAKSMITERCTALVNNLLEAQQDGLGNRDEENELRALNRLYCSIFPNIDLIVNNQKVDDFVKNII